MWSLDVAQVHVRELQRQADLARGHDGLPTLVRLRTFVARHRH